MSSHDVECLSVGAGILGCGGGGDPNIGRAAALQLLRDGKKISCVNPHRSVWGQTDCKSSCPVHALTNIILVDTVCTCTCIYTYMYMYFRLAWLV